MHVWASILVWLAVAALFHCSDDSEMATLCPTFNCTNQDDGPKQSISSTTDYSSMYEEMSWAKADLICSQHNMTLPPMDTDSGRLLRDATEDSVYPEGTQFWVYDQIKKTKGNYIYDSNDRYHFGRDENLNLNLHFRCFPKS